MPVRYKESDLELRQVKKKLLSKIKQLEETQTETEIKVKELRNVNILKI